MPQIPFYQVMFNIVLLGIMAVSSCSDHKTFNDPVCGDGAIDLGEECDGASLGAKTCVDLGFTGGLLSCSFDCTFDTRDCTGGCYDACIQNSSRCTAVDTLESCRVGPRGCTEWITFTCTGDTPFCVVEQELAHCASSPCLVDCTIGERRCSSDQHVRQICTLGENNCPYWDSSPCPDETPICRITDGVFSCEAI